MKCPQCGNELDANKKFCTKCGCNVEEYAKQQKAKEKEERAEKIYKIKKRIVLVLFLTLVIAIIVLIIFNLFGDKSHKSKEEYSVIENTTKNKEDSQTSEILYGGKDIEIEITEENKKLDFDKDRLTNEEEVAAGTNVNNSDTDGDGLSDYDEIKRYNSDPLKYSTSGDDISDYIKVKRDLDLNRKYTESEVKPEDVNPTYSVTLKPGDINSQYYGAFKEYGNDNNVKSTHNVFNLLDYEGTIEYNTGNENSILLLREGQKYSEFSNYKNEGGKLIITITKEDNYKDFVITTKDNYETYKKGASNEEKH